MTRPTRNDDHAGWFHVMNRGAGRRLVFRSSSDRRLFISLIAEASERHLVQIHAFCLMGNHYHLLVRCPDGGLSSFMQAIGGNYTRAFNRRIESDGPIFRSRFHSLPVVTGEYLDRVGRYIHRNPLEISEREPLARYLWSSYRYYVTGAPAPDWLRTDVLLDIHDGVDRYREYVEGTTVPAATSAILEWGIRTAIAEIADEELPTARLERSVAAALLGDVRPTFAAAAGELVEYPNPAARRQAVRRATRRMASDPSFAALVNRALDLAA